MRVKGLMPPKDGTSRETPTGKAVGRIWYGITFPTIWEFVMLLPISANFTILQKWEMTCSNHSSSPIMCFYLGIMRDFPLIPPVACHYNMDVLESPRKMLQNYYMR